MEEIMKTEKAQDLLTEKKRNNSFIKTLLPLEEGRIYM